jgi:hypothetical protein
MLASTATDYELIGAVTCRSAGSVFSCVEHLQGLVEWICLDLLLKHPYSEPARRTATAS